MAFSIRKQVLAALEASEGPLTIPQVHEKVSTTYEHVRQKLSEMERKHQIQRVDRGVYARLGYQEVPYEDQFSPPLEAELPADFMEALSAALATWTNPGGAFHTFRLENGSERRLHLLPVLVSDGPAPATTTPAIGTTSRTHGGSS